MKGAPANIEAQDRSSARRKHLLEDKIKKAFADGAKLDVSKLGEHSAYISALHEEWTELCAAESSPSAEEGWTGTLPAD